MKQFLIIIFGTLVFHANTNAQQNLVLRDSLDYSERLSDVWHYVDTAGGEWAIVGVKTGVSIVNVNNPDSIYEAHFIKGANSTWRDIRAWDDFVYVTNEQDSGLMIIDMRYLPDSVSYRNDMRWGLTSAHNVWVDEKGFAYLTGPDIGIKGALILDLNNDPWMPDSVGLYNEEYLHDCYVRNDTLFGGAIKDGWFSIVDVSDKSNPTRLATRNTPHLFTHNIWPSDDGKTVFTTDEKSGAFVTSYDITDIQNIEELGRYQSNPGSQSIPHNTHVLNDFLITSWYKDGVTIVDAARPHNMIQVGNYDTHADSGNGFDGVWGVTPYLPSGNLLVTDRDAGLHVFTPTYVRACYLEGRITDAAIGLALSGVQIYATSDSDTLDLLTPFSGKYASGLTRADTFEITYSKAGYFPRTIKNVELRNGELTEINVKLVPDTVSNCNVQAAILNTDPKICVDAFANLINSSTNAYDISWYVNEVYNSNKDTILQQFPDSGFFDYMLIAHQGICDDTTHYLFDVVNPPSADFSVVDSNLSADFTYTGTSDATTYEWDFGDGQYANIKDPSHSYSNPGTYTVCVTVTSFGNCWEQICKEIEIECMAVSASWSHTGTGPAVQFTDLSINPTNWLWRFDTLGTDTIQDPVYSFPSSGIWEVCLEINNGCHADTLCQDISLEWVTPGIDANLSAIKVYPSLFQNTIYIQSDKALDIFVMNALGSIEATHKIIAGLNRVDLSMLENGIKLIKFGTSPNTMKLIKSN